MTIQKTLKERQKTHGDFSGHAEIAQQLKAQIRYFEAQRGCDLEPDQRESLEMICHKIARILNGNPNHKDHWHDIAGYAELIAGRL
jgi:hypothetical protein